MSLAEESRPSPILRPILWVDAAVELVVGVFLLGLVGSPHEWLDVSRSASVVASIVFLVAALAVGFLALRVESSLAYVRYLAYANIVGGVVVWLALLIRWGEFDSEGRWLASAVADMFILLGVLELLALRRRIAP